MAAVCELCKKHEASFLTAEEIDLSQGREGLGHFDWTSWSISGPLRGDGPHRERQSGGAVGMRGAVPEGSSVHGSRTARENMHSDTNSVTLSS